MCSRDGESESEGNVKHGEEENELDRVRGEMKREEEKD